MKLKQQTMKLSKRQVHQYKEEGFDLKFIARTQPQGGLYFMDDYIRTGDGYVGCLHTYRYAEDVPKLWLTDLMNQENTIATLDIATANKRQTLLEINRAIDELRDREDTERRTTDKDDAYYERMNLRQFAQRVTQGGEIIKEVHLRIFLVDYSLPHLEERMKELKGQLEGLNHKITVNLIRQDKEYQSLGLSYEKQSEAGMPKGPVLPSESIGGGIPFHYQYLKDPRGIYLGQTSSGGAFILDLFYSTDVRRFFNMFVLGNMGYGKSTLLKMLEEGLVGRGCFIRGFDKARDFHDLIEHQGGKIVDLAGGENRINPLHVYATITDVTGEKVDEYGSFLQQVESAANDIRFLNPEITQIELKEYKALLIKFYVHIGLLPKNYIKYPENIRITGRKSEEYPTMSEFRTFLNSVTYENPTPQRVRTLEKLQIMVDEMINAYAPLLDGHTTIDDLDKEQIVFFDIDAISIMSKEIFHCQLFKALKLIWNNAVKNGRYFKRLFEEGKISFEDIKYFAVFIDECQNVINFNNPFAVEFIATFQAEMRKFFAGIIFATQSPNKILPDNADSANIAMMKAIFELTQYKVFLNLDNSVLGKMKEVLGESLNESEYQRLPTLKIGEAIIQTTSTDSYLVHLDPEKDQLERFKGGQ